MAATRKREWYRIGGLLLLAAVVVITGLWYPADRIKVDLADARARFDAQSAAVDVGLANASSGDLETELPPVELDAAPPQIIVEAGAAEETGIEPVESQSVATDATDAPDPASNAEVILLVGSDQRADKLARADAILLLVAEEARAALISIPRYLTVDSPCREKPAPLNVNLTGCSGVSGLEALGIAVEDYTGVAIDHFAVFDFDGFTGIVDLLGGYEVCVDRPVKLRADQRVFLETGCTTLDGRDSLRWVRARAALEQHPDEWQLIDGGGDQVRTGRQRDMVRYVFEHLRELDNPGELLEFALSAQGMVTVDDSWNLAQAAALAWDLRRARLELAAVGGEFSVNPDGELVTVPNRTFAEVLAEALG